MRVVADVSGLNPGQQHGFHVHEAGDCSQPTGNAGARVACGVIKRS